MYLSNSSFVYLCVFTDINHMCNLNNTDDMAACQKAKYGQLTVAEANDPVLASCAYVNSL